MRSSSSSRLMFSKSVIARLARLVCSSSEGRAGCVALSHTSAAWASSSSRTASTSALVPLEGVGQLRGARLFRGRFALEVVLLVVGQELEAGLHQVERVGGFPEVGVGRLAGRGPRGRSTSTGA